MEEALGSTSGHALRHSILLAVLISAMVFLVCPAFIASNNLADLDAIPLASSAKTLLLAFVASTLALILLTQVKIARPFFYGLLAFVTLAALVFPVTGASAMVDAEQQQTNALNLTICLVISIAFGIGSVKFDLVKKLGVNIVIFVTLISLFFSVTAITSHGTPKSNPGASNFSVLSNKKNILVMSFDGVPGVILREVLEENQETNSDFKDFTFFSNTYSQSPSTTASIIGEIHGVQDFKAIAPTEAQLKSKLLQSELYKNNYVLKVEDFQHRYPHAPGEGTTLNFNTIDQLSNLFLLKNSLSRIFTSEVFKTGIPSIFEYFLREKEKGNRVSFGTEQDHKGAAFDFKNVVKIKEFDDFVSSLGATDETDFSVRYYHNVFSHFPVDFGENCEYLSYDRELVKNAQNHEGLKKQTHCVYKKMQMLLAKLKEIGAYDNSIIVFKSDHGEPFWYFDNPPDNLSINGQRRFGYNRYRPFLMVKNFDVDQPSLKYDDRTVLLNDLAKTLCKASGVLQPKACDQHNGIDLFSDEKGLDQPYYLYIFKSSKSTYQYDTHMSVKVPNRRVDVIEFLKSSGLVEFSDEVKPMRVVK